MLQARILLLARVRFASRMLQRKSRKPSQTWAASQSSRAKHLLLAPLVEKRRLTHAASTKVTLHLAFSTAGTGLSYQAGDACGVVPQNDPNLVAEILQHLHFNGNEQVHCEPGRNTTLHGALLHHLQIT